MLSEKADGKIAKHNNSKNRVKRFRERQASIGRLKREMYLTNGEFASLKQALVDIRNHKQEIKIILCNVDKLEVGK